MTRFYRQVRIPPKPTEFINGWYQINKTANAQVVQVSIIAFPGTIIYLGQNAPTEDSEGVIIGPTGILQYDANEDYFIGNIYIKEKSVSSLPEGAYIVIDYEEVAY